MSQAKNKNLSIDTLFQLAVSFHQQQRFQDAIKLYESVLLANPTHADAWHMQGLLEARSGQNAQAVKLISQAILLNPTKSAYFNNRGLSLQAQQYLTEALGDFQKALSLEPDLAQAHNNLGNLFVELQRCEEALLCFTRAIELQPDYADAYFNRANLHVMMRNVMGAIADFEQALDIVPQDLEIQFNKAHALLLIGEYEKAWPLYESRLAQNAVKNDYPKFDVPLWSGDENIQGKTILIHAEQGLGDTLQFIRYVPMLASLGAKVIVQVPLPLFGLFEKMQGISVLMKNGELLPPFDFHCPMMSLPLAFNTKLDTIPSCPQFSIPQSKVQYWRHQSDRKEKLLVGLVWASGFHPSKPGLWKDYERRNLPFQQLKKLSGLNVDFISLQKGEPAETEFKQTVALDGGGPEICNYVNELKDFSDTAALVMNLDLVISVDTATAHLSASLGKPVWLLARYDACWRWGLEREDSPWYPSLKIYRQPSLGDWDTVMLKIRHDLVAMCADHHQ
jgi:tetratricopeptide (TPR) repeat protein